VVLTSLSPYASLIPRQRPISCLLMLNNPLWIARLLGLLRSASIIRIMNRLALHILQLRNPFPNILPIGIKLLALQKRIENPKIWLRIYARAGAESPSAVIRCEVAVNEMLHEVALAHAPVNEQVFGEEGGYDHAAAVMHPADCIELSHSGVDDGVASAALAPGFELFVIVLPFNVAVFWFEGFIHTGYVSDLHLQNTAVGNLTRHKASGQERVCRNRAKRPHLSKSEYLKYQRQVCYWCCAFLLHV
jgi:hypothetical protein